MVLAWKLVMTWRMYRNWKLSLDARKKRGDSVGSAYPFKDGKLMTIRKRVGRLNSSSSYISLCDVFPQGSLCWLKEGRQPKIRGLVILMFIYSIYMFIIFPIYVVTKLHSLWHLDVYMF